MTKSIHRSTAGAIACLAALPVFAQALGDQAHFRENYDNNGVPTFNFNRADTLTSFERFKQIAKNLHAAVIIQHDPRDIDELPAFPAAAQ